MPLNLIVGRASTTSLLPFFSAVRRTPQFQHEYPCRGCFVCKPESANSVSRWIIELRLAELQVMVKARMARQLATTWTVGKPTLIVPGADP